MRWAIACMIWGATSAKMGICAIRSTACDWSALGKRVRVLRAKLRRKPGCCPLIVAKFVGRQRPEQTLLGDDGAFAIGLAGEQRQAAEQRTGRKRLDLVAVDFHFGAQLDRAVFDQVQALGRVPGAEKRFLGFDFARLQMTRHGLQGVRRQPGQFGHGGSVVGRDSPPSG